MAIPGTFEKNPQSQQVSFAPNMPSITTGNGNIDMVLSMLMNNSGVAPRPYSGQSVYESFQQRDRSNDFLKVMNQGVNQMPIIKKLGGLDMDSGFGSMLGPFINKPGGIADNPIMRAMNGGNPIAAQMSMLSRGTGLTAANMTGKFQNLSTANTASMMEGMNSALFNTKKFSQADVNDVREDINTRIDKKTLRAGNSLLSGGSEGAELKNAVQELKALNDAQQNKGEISKLGVFDQSGNVNLEKVIGLQNKDNRADIDTDKLGNAGEDTVQALKKVSKTLADKTKEIVDPLQQAKKDVQGKLGTTVLNGINAQATRGFETQDLTKTMMMGVDLGMIDYKQSLKKNLGSHQGATEDSMKHLGKVMRAGADLFGTETAADTMTAVNQLFGNSRLNLNNETDAKYATDLMRRVKSTARVAGVSTDEIMRLHQTTQTFAAARPELGLTGGAAQMEDTLKSVQEAHSMAASMGSGRIRELGGMVNFTQEEIASKALVKTQPINKRLMGMLGYIENIGGLTDEQRGDLRKKLISSAKSDTMDQAGLLKLTTDLANSSNGKFNAVEAQNAQNNETLIQAGFQQNERAKKEGKGSIDEDRTISNYFDERMRSDLRAQLSQGPLMVNEINENGGLSRTKKISTVEEGMTYYNNLYKTGEAQKLGYGDNEQLFSVKMGLSPNAVTEQLFGAGSPQGKAFMAAKRRTAYRDNLTPEQKTQFDEQIKKQAVAEEAMAQNLAHLQQPLGQSVAQLLVNGQFGQGVEPLMRILKTPEAMNAVQSTRTAVDRMNTLQTAQSRDTTFLTATGGAGNPAEIKTKLKSLGYTDQQIADIQTQRAAYEDSTGKKALEDLTANGKLTLANLEAYSSLSGDEYAQAGFKESTGLDLEQIKTAKNYAEKTGLLNAKSSEKFKNQKLNKNTVGRMYQDYAAYRTLDLATNNAIDPDTINKSRDALDAGLANASADVKKQITDRFKGTDGNIDMRKVGRAFANEGLSTESVQSLEKLSLMDNSGNLDKEKYLKTINENTGEDADRLRQEGLNSGLLNYDAGTGKYTMTTANQQKYADQLQSYYGLQELGKGIDKNSGSYDTLKSLGEMMTKIQETVDQSKKDTGNGDGVGTLVDLKTAIENGIQSLTEALTSVATQLTGLTNIGG